MALTYNGVTLEGWNISGNNPPPEGQPERYKNSYGDWYVWNGDGYEPEDEVTVTAKANKAIERIKEKIPTWAIVAIVALSAMLLTTIIIKAKK